MLSHHRRLLLLTGLCFACAGQTVYAGGSGKAVSPPGSDAPQQDAPRFITLADKPRTGIKPDLEQSAYVESARAALAAYVKQRQLDESALDDLHCRFVNRQTEGLVVVAFQRIVGGIPVYDDYASVIMNGAGEPAGMAVRLHTGAAGKLDKSGAPVFPLTEKEVLDALPAGGAKDSPPRFMRQLYSDGKLLHPAYRIERYEYDSRIDHVVLRGYLVSAEDATILDQASLTDELAPFRYRVFADSGRYPYDDPYGVNSPHPTGIPDGYRPSTPAAQQLVDVSNLSATTDDPWLPGAATETVGNAVDAFFDALPDPTFESPEFRAADGDFRARTTSDHVFDYVYDVSRAPDDFDGPPSPDDPQINAKIVNDFYVANMLHDYFYDAGFNEAAGNAQEDNYGRGGIGGDRLIVHAAGALGTVAFTPGDGASPVLELGLNSYSGSHRGADLDLSTISHEWMHTMVRRLVGGGVSFLENNQGGALNEGWADFAGLLMQTAASPARAATVPAVSETFATGAYFNLDYAFPWPVDSGTAAPDAYYYGIRRYPYSSDRSKNPLIFPNIETGKPLPMTKTLPVFDWKGRSRLNAEFHSSGEVWAVMLWDCYRSILERHGSAALEEMRARMAKYLVAGMEITPPNPTFTEARDALLTAMRVVDAGDYENCRAAFARRRMGAGAVSPPRESLDHSGLQAGYADSSRLAGLSLVASHVDDNGAGADRDGIIDVGEPARLVVRLRNTGFVTVSGIRVALVPTSNYSASPWLTVGTLRPGEEAEVAVPVTLLDTTTYAKNYFYVNAYGTTAAGGTTWPFTVSLRTNYDLVRDSTSIDAAYPETFDNWSTLREGWPDLGADPNWKPNGWFYAVTDPYSAYSVALESPIFRVAADQPLVIKIEHSYYYVNSDGLTSGRIRLQISVEGGDWIDAQDIIDTGTFGNLLLADYPSPVADRLDFGLRFAGRYVRFRFYAESWGNLTKLVGGWQIKHVDLSGAADPPFFRVVPDR